jgi:hypothetical protein
MSKTIKKRPMKKARNWDVVGMILGCKGEPMRHRSDRRSKDAKRSWKNEEWM